MEYDKTKIRNRSPPTGRGSGSQLEERAGKLGLDTDVMNFLAIAGWGFAIYASPYYKSADEKLRQELRERRAERRAKLSASEKQIESRLFHSLLEAGYESGRVRTLGQVKRLLEENGTLPGVHYKTLVHFNDTLGRYGFTPFMIKDRCTSKSATR